MKRTFIIGDEWIYYKLYCGKRTAEKVLIDTIRPLSERLIEKRIIDKWFFIRYSDPDFHLRIRFHCKKTDDLIQVISVLNHKIKSYMDDGLIWKIQTDTYQREVERYGLNTIEDAEFFFFIDSRTCLKVLNLVKSENTVFMCTLRSIDNLLNIFGFSNQEKITFVHKNLSLFKTEFNSDKSLSKQLYKKHELLEGQIMLFMKKN